MPLKRKKNHSFLKVLIWLVIATIIILMMISFSTPQHMTEIIVYP